ncbi:MAG: MMPL family transporter [Christensenellaceae bacterium]|jgi:predicted RND superfamily exporter protein|nr:MMPL family transporter [Christensenellaceae bacterium]
MKKISNFIVKYHLFLLVFFVASIIVACIFIPKVNINNDITKYLPQGSPSVEAIKKLTDAFGGQTSTQIMIENITPQEAIQIKEQLANVDGINSVVYDENNNYKDNSALFVVNMDYDGYSSEAKDVIENIRQILNLYDIYLSGDVISSSYMDTVLSRNMPIILAISCVIILLILIFTSTSWIDPLIFAIILGGAIAINLGTNALLPNVSFITHSICVIMQMALAMDYSIMLLHRFNEEKQKNKNRKEALSTALARTFGLVSSSSLTTIASLTALMFMQFTIGLDVGLVLAKGVLISMLCVFLFMPGVLLLMAKPLEKTKHRSMHALILNGVNKRYNEIHSLNTNADQNFATALSNGQEPKVYKPKKVLTFGSFQKATKVIIPCIILVLIVVGTYFQQTNLQYTYSINTATDKNAAVNVDSKKIQERFGLQNGLVVMVPKGDYEKEKLLEDYILNYQAHGQNIINSSFTFLNTGLLKEYSANEFVSEFNIPNPIVMGVFALMQKDPDTDSVMLIDFLEAASTSQFAITYLQPLQTVIDNLYQNVAALTVPLDAYQFAAVYNTDPTHAEEIWTDLGQSFNTPIETHIIISYIVQNISFIQITQNPMAQAQFIAIYSLYQISNLQLVDIVDMLEQGSFPYLPNEYAFMLADMINSLDIPPLDTVYELFEYLSQNQTVTTLAADYQQEIDAAYMAANTARSMFENGSYSRLIFNINLAVTDPNAFAFIKDLRVYTDQLYGENYIAGGSPTMLDISETFNSDIITINLIAFLAILLILLMSFRSISIALLLTLLIQGAIFITMGSNAILGSPIFFICYLLVMCIQMGATIDYAILISDRYIEARKTNNKYKSAAIALERSITTILTSGLIITLSSFVVGFMSEVALISAFGKLLGLGCLISMLVIIFSLPQILILCDKIIKKTTYKADFSANKTAEPLYLSYEYENKSGKEKAKK